MSAAALPPLAPGVIPDGVSAAGPAAVDRFHTALSFERVLLEKLLSEALPEEGEGEGEGGGPRAVNLAETLSGAIVSEGGAGIASDLFGDGGEAL